ncbi:MAG: hypothetical protein AAGA71_20445 [Pseudomonadota bacterium]
MTLIIRPATPDDIDQMIALLLLDAEERQRENPVLWKVAPDASNQIAKALTFAVTAEQQPFQQLWRLAKSDGQLVGVAHAMRLPVPPIYAGPQGDPGLILPDCVTAPGAPAGTVDALMEVAESELSETGAKILLSSLVTQNEWAATSKRRGYTPITLYLSKSGLAAGPSASTVRPATEQDIPGIVARSAEHRAILFSIDPFWEIHPKADARFAAWMTRSLTLRDRDMLVLGDASALEGYAIAQPASRLHFPPAHDITGVGVLDDFYHRDIADPDALPPDARGARSLLHAAEAAFTARDIDTAFFVCPADWTSKLDLLTAAGYQTAMTWSMKRLEG